MLMPLRKAVSGVLPRNRVVISNDDVVQLLIDLNV